jgi:hypothetical protein
MWWSPKGIEEMQSDPGYSWKGGIATARERDGGGGGIIV